MTPFQKEIAMSDSQQRIEQLTRSNRILKLTCAVTASLFFMGAGMAMQAGFNDGQHDGGDGMVEAAVPVHDSTGYAVFARVDGNLIIVKEDGTVIRTQNQPLSVSF